MTYNVLSGMLNPTLSVCQSIITVSRTVYLCISFTAVDFFMLLILTFVHTVTVTSSEPVIYIQVMAVLTQRTHSYWKWFNRKTI